MTCDKKGHTPSCCIFDLFQHNEEGISLFSCFGHLLAQTGRGWRVHRSERAGIQGAPAFYFIFNTLTTVTSELWCAISWGVYPPCHLPFMQHPPSPLLTQHMAMRDAPCKLSSPLVATQVDEEGHPSLSPPFDTTQNNKEGSTPPVLKLQFVYNILLWYPFLMKAMAWALCWAGLGLYRAEGPGLKFDKPEPLKAEPTHH